MIERFAKGFELDTHAKDDAWQFRIWVDQIDMLEERGRKGEEELEIPLDCVDASVGSD